MKLGRSGRSFYQKTQPSRYEQDVQPRIQASSRPTQKFLRKALQSDGTHAEVARAYDIHPVTLSNWKKKLKENGSKAFGSGDELKQKNDKIAKLERMVGKKEVEIALLKNFLGEDGDLRSP
jgi:transposase